MRREPGVRPFRRALIAGMVLLAFDMLLRGDVVGRILWGVALVLTLWDVDVVGANAMRFRRQCT